jgi:phosphatidylethanolamine/phosphatidyl-N-methylethanolamine N-methyltransferase
MPDSERAVFLREFLHSPLRTAAVAPSSPGLAEQMVAAVPEDGDPVVVELGPGTGSFTAAIQRRLAGRGRHIAIELNPSMAAHVSRRYPGVEVVTGAAADLPEVLVAHGIRGADHVVSGLGWSAFTGSLVGTISASLAPAGVFTQFAYTCWRWMPPARGLLNQLRLAFGEVVITRTVWRNLPPALVYMSRRPIP